MGEGWARRPAQFNALLDREQEGGPSFGRALDICCGTGDHAVNLARRGWDVTAVDFVPRALDVGRAKAVEAGVDVRWVLSMLVRPRATGISTSSSRLVSGSTGCTGREPGDDQTNVTSSRTVTLGGDQGVHTLALSVIERTREIGLLRAVGMGRPQLRRLVRLEPSVPVGRLLALLAIAGALGVLAAVWPALMSTWRARSRSMSKLVRTKFRRSGDCPLVEQVAVPPEAAAARPADAVRDDRVELYRDAGAGHCATIVGAVVGTRRSPAHRRRP